MNCSKCKQELDPAWVACPFCGTKQQPKKKKAPRRGNGSGTAYRRGKSWTAKVVIGWRIEEGEAVPVTRTKGGFKSKTEALAYCAELREHPNRMARKITFSKLYSNWLEKHAERVTASTMGCYTAAYSHCKPLWHLPFADLTGDELQAVIDGCPCGKRTKENIKALLSLLYKYAMHNDIVDRNRAETLYTGNDQKTTRPAITLEELELIKRSSNPYAPYVVALCYLGFRPGELLKLRKSDYDPVHRYFIGGSKTDAGRDRVVTISPKIQSIIDWQYQLAGDWMFPKFGTNQKMSDDYFRKFCFDPLMAELGIVDRVPYSCRHTFANLLKNVRGSDTDKASLIGHSDASMTKYYQSADYESLRAITDVL